MTQVLRIDRSQDAVFNLVFLHGLDGDPVASWRATKSEPAWPSWFAEALPRVAVWSVGYDASSSGWRGHSMSIHHRSVNVLAALRSRGIDQLPTCFVAHSMGGLIVKQMLLLSSEPGADLGSLATATKGAVFLSTPNAGSKLAEVVEALRLVYRRTPAVKDLQRDLPNLIYMSNRYRDWAATTDIRQRVYFETRETKGFQVVDESSSDPGIAGVRPIPLDADHIDICKPTDKDAQVHVDVLSFVQTLLAEQLHGAEAVDDEGSVPGLARISEVETNTRRIIRPSPGRADWRKLLDGAPLSGEFLSAGVLSRKVALNDEERDPEAVLEWLRKHPGRTLFLRGERGDGKTSYLNLLAAQAITSHAFLQCSYDSPLEFTMPERDATALGIRAPLVLVYSVSPTQSDDALSELVQELERVANSQVDHTVIIVEGDEPTIDRLHYYSAHDIRLLPPGDSDVATWVGLLEHAHDAVLSLDGPAALEHRYPNLSQFLAAPSEEHERVLADSDSPVIVRLLRAIYGPEFWGKLFREYLELKPPAPDALAYLHVALASIAGSGIPVSIEQVLQPDANWRDRSHRDPWTFSDHDDHRARHPVIAQAVLERAAAWSNGRLIQDCTYSLAANVRVTACAQLLRDIVLASVRLPPLSETAYTDRLRKAIYAGTRRGLGQVEDLPGALLSQCQGNWTNLAAWMQVLRTILPSGSPEPSLVWIIDLHSDLLDAAPSMAGAPEEQNLHYYRTKLTVWRAWHVREDTYDVYTDAAYDVSSMIGSSWCRSDFYSDLFSWCHEAISSRRTEQMSDGDVTEVRFLYSLLFTAYLRLATMTPEIAMNKFRFNLSRVMLRYLHWQLPNAATELLHEAWETSRAIGRFDPVVGSYAAELLIAEGEAEQARAILRDVVASWPHHDEAVLLMALVTPHTAPEAPALMGVIHEAQSVAEGLCSRARLDHAEALLEQNSDRRLELLLRAIEGYTLFIDERWRRWADDGAFALDRLRFTSESALTELAGLDVETARRARKRFESVGVARRR